MAQSNLVDLSNAAKTGDWFKCEQVLHGVLDQMQASKALEIAIGQMLAFLSTFEFYHPEIKWPRILLTLLAETKPIDYISTPLGIYDENVSSPGSDAFLRGLGLLDSAARREKDDPEKSKSLAASAIVHVISARHFEYWANKHPRDWEDWQKTINSEDDNLAVVARSKYVKNENAQQFARSIWLHLIDEIGAML